jgi:AraC-like DNA-binding protein
MTSFLLDRSAWLLRNPHGVHAAQAPAWAGLRVRGVLFASAELSPPWGVLMPQQADQVFCYFTQQGSCVATLPAPSAPIDLAVGDLLVVKGPLWHAMSDQPGRPFTPLDQLISQDRRFDVNGDDEVLKTMFLEPLRQGGQGPHTTKAFNLGVFLDPHSATPWLRALPPALHLPGFWHGAGASCLPLLSQLRQEGAAGLMGQHIATRLCEILLMKVIQAYLDQLPDSQRGLAGGLKDPYLATALQALYASPGEPWTVDRLAAQVGLSRWAFSEHFSQVIGQSPSQFLTVLRMERALELLQHSSLPLGRIGEAVGYGSDAAFSRAFRRWRGEPPGAVRRRHLSAR